MKAGIVAIAYTPVRQEPSEQSGQVTQLLFGELCEILDEKNNWFHIRAMNDDYEGWSDIKMITLLNQDTYNEMLRTDPVILPDPFMTVIRTDTDTKLVIPAGSSAWRYREKDYSFTNGEMEFRLEQKPALTGDNFTANSLETVTAGFINTPYLWGGKSTFGCDCSGFVQTVLKIFGKQLPRDAAEQVKPGENIPFLNDAFPGDLAFFDNEEGEINHVGILLDYNRIIHASGRVRADAIDQEGIYNRELGKYTHKLRTIKRVL